MEQNDGIQQTTETDRKLQQLCNDSQPDDSGSR